MASGRAKGEEHIKGYSSGSSGDEIPVESDKTPGRPDLGPEGLHYENKEFLGRDTARIAEAVADKHEHHEFKHHVHSKHGIHNEREHHHKGHKK